ncbi:MAG: hypothetical protein Kow0037_19960 [Calditrichia bacterium]
MSNRIIKVRRPVRRVKVLSSAEAMDKGVHPAFGAEQELPASAPSAVSAPETPPGIQMSEEELQQQLQTAFHKGVEEGRQAAQQEVMEQIQPVLQQWNNIMANFEQERLNYYAESEKLLLNFILQMAEKIFPEIPGLVANQIEKSVSEVISVLKNEQNIELIINPADQALLEKLRKQIELGLPNLENLSIKTDNKITPGGCMVQTDAGKIDARIETQIQKVISELRKEIEMMNRQEVQE